MAIWLLQHVLLVALLLDSISAVDFIFNGFDSADLLIYGNATVESRILALTRDSNLSLGRALYPAKIPTRRYPNSSLLLPFFTSFIFSMAPAPNFQPGHGFVFIFAPRTGIDGATSSQHLGLFNRTNDGDVNNHVFGVEFDVFQNQEFNDIDNNHVGVDLNNLRSSTAQTAGYWDEDDDHASSSSFKDLTLNNGVNYQVWIDYSNSQLNVTMAKAGTKRPQKPLISTPLNLSDVLLDEMYVGFTGSTGVLVQYHRILAWSFSNSNFSIGDALETNNLPSFVPPKSSFLKSKWFIAVMTVVSIAILACIVGIALFLVRRKRRRKRDREAMEDWELEYWPHRISYQEIYTATNGFSDEKIIGFGGNGKVYKGVLGGTEVAVKRISHETEHGAREFLAEVSSLGRLKHRNLVGLRGWCKKDKSSLFLIYDYMENGSLDKWVFECDENLMLGWEERLRVLKDVASGVLYLHEGWEARVVHRDIKASNVLLDKDMNGRLGDFGLARMHSHGEAANTTRVVGTVGYLAPELIRTGKASAETDVFGFGILVLEVICGRRPVEEGKPVLVDWLWELLERGELLCAVDERLRAKGGLDDDFVEKVLHLGLLCAYPDLKARPTMRQVVKVLERKSEFSLDLQSFEVEAREGPDVSLLEMMKIKFMSSSSSLGGRHPTIGEIRQSLSSSMSLSDSDVIVDGR